MKEIILILLFSISIFSCEKVIDVELDNIEPILVVDANIEWLKGTTGESQSLFLSLSSNYFNEEFNPVENATVSISKLNTSETIDFKHTSNGKYTTSNFLPEVDAEYELKVVYNNEIYLATEQLIATPKITKTEQRLTTGFDGEEVIRFDFFAQDEPKKENFYFVKYKRSSEEQPYFTIRDDEFRDGNEINFLLFGASTTSGEPLVAGEVLNIEFMGVSENYANYIELLLEQAYNGGGPFSSTPVQLKGNVKKITLPEQRAFGYFRLSEKEVLEVTLE